MPLTPDVCRRCRGNTDTKKMKREDSARFPDIDPDEDFDVWFCSYCDAEYKAAKGKATRKKITRTREPKKIAAEETIEVN